MELVYNQAKQQAQQTVGGVRNGTTYAAFS
jgi:hypothetical protein